jgi:hypothetical protein
LKNFKWAAFFSIKHEQKNYANFNLRGKAFPLGSTASPRRARLAFSPYPLLLGAKNECRFSPQAPSFRAARGKIHFAGIALVFCAALVFFACKTPQSRALFSPYSLMDDDTEMFFLLPVRAHFDSALAISQKFFPDYSQKDLRRIVSRIDTVYGGWSELVTANANRVQFVFTGQFPRAALNSALVPKNGWTQITASVAGVKTTWYKNAQENIEVYAEIPNMLIVSNNALPMIERLKASLAGGFETAETRPHWLQAALGTAEAEDALFYVPRVASVLEKAAHINIPSLGAFTEASVEGRLSKAVSQMSVLWLDIDLKDRRAAAPAMLLLSLTGVFADAKVVQDGSHINITMPAHESLLVNLLF